MSSLKIIMNRKYIPSGGAGLADRLSTVDGVTLIEVMVALLVVTVGLLSLQGLGIGAVRALVVADRQTAMTILMADSLESALAQLRRGVIPDEFCVETPWGDRVSGSVEVSVTLATVSVHVVRETDDSPGPYRMSSAVFLPEPLEGADAGGACG